MKRVCMSGKASVTTLEGVQGKQNQKAICKDVFWFLC